MTTLIRSTLASRRRPDHLTLLIAAIALAGFGVVMARQVAYGPVLGQDAIRYVSIAQNLLAGQGFTWLFDEPYTVWPPLYPLTLAAATLGVFSPSPLPGR